jgi:microcystin-dependent protein
MKNIYFILVLSICSLGPLTVDAQEPFIGEVRIFAGTFAPRGWANCDGQLLPVAQNTALFSLLGTTYGGDGRTTFGVPDLRGRAATQPGRGPGLQAVELGQRLGTATTTLTANQIPTHSHLINGVSEAGSSSTPAGNFPANTNAADPEYAPSGTFVPMNAGMIGNSTTNEPIENRQPSIGVRYIIALQGIYPSRS